MPSNHPPRAGKSTRQMARRRYHTAIFIALAAIAVFAGIILYTRNVIPPRIAGIGTLIVLFFFFVINKQFGSLVDKKLDEVARAIRGAKAEEQIGEILASLSSDYYVLNDVVSPYGNIDHIVISKYGGVFLIETKAHRGRVEVKGDSLLVNGKNPEKDFIAQALRNTLWLKDELGRIVGSKPWISSFIVFTNAFVPPTRPVKGVRIINKKYLLDNLCRPSQSNAVNTQIWQHRQQISAILL